MLTALHWMIGVWLSACCIIGSAMAAAPQLPPGTILVLGDSLSAGYGLPARDAWPARLHAAFEADRLPYKVINAGISGDTSAGGRARLPKLLERHEPVLVIIALGANDGLRGLPLSALRENLEAMIGLSREAGAEVLLAGMALPSNYGLAYVRQFRTLYRDLVQAHGVAFLPFLEDVLHDRALFLDDGLHPNARGQLRVADAVRRALERSFTLAHERAARADQLRAAISGSTTFNSSTEQLPPWSRSTLIASSSTST